MYTAYPSSCQQEPQQHQFTHKYVECFYWRPQICCVFLLAPTFKLSLCRAAQIQTKIWRSFLLGGAAARICMKICIACSHVGQMLFAGNKYLLLKRITVLRQRFFALSYRIVQFLSSICSDYIQCWYSCRGDIFVLMVETRLPRLSLPLVQAILYKYLIHERNYLSLFL